MKKRLLILLIGILIIGVVNGTESETQSNFTISGCSLGETGLADGSCSPEGDYFCSYGEGNYTLYDTIYDYTGCSYGATTYTPGQPFCCPSGYFCENGAEGPICNLREGDCLDQLTKNDCENMGCYWLLIEGGICTESLSDYDCNIYQTLETCTEDKFKLGQTGVGTAICGTYFTIDDIGYIIPFESCRCEWNSTCIFAYDTLKEFNNGTTVDSFKCIKNFEIGECTNGTQLITWNATPQILSGYPSGIPQSVLEATKCVDNTEGAERYCGMPILKLFGFSLLSFFVSLGIIGLFYFLKESKNQRD